MKTNDGNNSPTKDGETTIVNPKKRMRDREKANEAYKRYYYRKKAKPSEYAEYLKKKANNKVQRFKNLSEENKQKERLKRNAQHKSYFDRKKASDPTFVKNNARKQLRNRVRDGTATEEEKGRYRKLLESNKASVKKYQLAQKEKARERDDNLSSWEKERPTKRRKT